MPEIVTGFQNFHKQKKDSNCPSQNIFEHIFDGKLATSEKRKLDFTKHQYSTLILHIHLLE